MAANIKRDDNKQKWESSADTEFPLVCETCLGDNPYVRMTKEPHGKKCQICENPFTVFAWQAGTKGRMKRVEICRNCAQTKNVCQVCIYDLQYGLPVKVRDKILRESGASGAGGGVASAIPQSNANRAWYTAQQQRALEQGAANNDNVGALAHAKLSEMANMEPRYERNLPKLCSFYAKGECDRGSNCPFRHEMPRDRNDPMSKQTTKDRFYGSSDPVANRILGRKRRQEELQKKQDDDDGYDKARATVYVRIQGEPPYPHFTEMDVRDSFYSFGEIVSVRPQPDKGQAFVEYTQPEAAELAIASMNRKEWLGGGRQIYTSWARAPKRGETTTAVVQQQETQHQQRRRGGGGGESSSTNKKSGNTATTNTTTTTTTSSSSSLLRPLAPPGGSSAAAIKKKPLPGLTVKPPPEVAALAAARRAKLTEAGGDGSGGGSPSKKPYYPSSDPSRLGSKAS